MEAEEYDEKKTSLDYMKKNRKEKKPSKWNSKDEEKFYDAIAVFGNDSDYIHSIIFDKKARKRYKDPENDFSERSLTQLKNKKKNDEKKLDNEALDINDIVKKNKRISTVQDFEKKYNIDIIQFTEDKIKRLERDNKLDAIDEDNAEFEI